MTELIPNIYQLKLPLPMPDVLLGYINVYLVRGDDGYLLVDTGWNTSEAFNSLEKQLAEIGVGFNDISQIVATHFHPDHYGMAGKIKELSHAKFALHYLEKDLIESRYINMDILLQQMSQLLQAGGVPPDELSGMQTASLPAVKFVVTTTPDITLHGGETISTGTFTFKVLWTPGHSPGHVCLYEPTQKILFSGDHILPNITPNVGLHPQSGDNPLDSYTGSLNAIKRLEIDLVLPGHENPFTGLRRRIERIIQHHQQRSLKILAVVGAEPKTAYQIAERIPWLTDIAGISWQNLSLWNKRLALLETLAHLESIIASGKIKRFSTDSLIYYQRA